MSSTVMQQQSADQIDFRDLVRPNSVHRRLYTDPDIFALEQERLFRRAWLYVGHESQVPGTGDFFTTELAGQPVVMVRHLDGEVRVLYNRCGHRGAKVVVKRVGRAQSFVCGYHAWTYDTAGRLKHVPAHDGDRSRDFSLSNPCFSMPPLPRCKSYRGFVFASLSSTGPEFEDYFGGVLRQIDQMVERAPDGSLEIAGGCLQIVQNSNWKIFLENIHDGLHPMFVHRSSIEASRKQAREQRGEPSFALKVIMANNQTIHQMDSLPVTTFEWGHSFMAGFRNPKGEDDVYRSYVQALEQRKGEARAGEILAVNCHNAIFYPNASVQPSFLQMRVIFPISANRTRIEMWSFKLKGAPDALFERTIAYANTVHSPSSLIRPDDVEMYDRVQEGLRVEAQNWVSQHRDAGCEETVDGTRRASSISDLSVRNQYCAWLKLMQPEAD